MHRPGTLGQERGRRFYRLLGLEFLGAPPATPGQLVRPGHLQPACGLPASQAG